MSLLHKNGILKEYRRQHREELAAQQAAEAATGSSNNNTYTNSGNAAGGHASEDDDEFPDVAAFQVVGVNTSASPSYVRPSSQFSVMSTMGEGNMTATNTAASSSRGNSHTRDADRGKTGETNGKLWPSSLTIRTSFQDENDSKSKNNNYSNTAGAKDGGGSVRESLDERSRPKSVASSSSRGTSAVPPSKLAVVDKYRVAASDDSSAEADKEDNENDAEDAFGADDGPEEMNSSPLSHMSRARRATAAAADNEASAGTEPQKKPPVVRTRSDLTNEEDRAQKDSQLHSPGTDPTVSPTTLTTGVETFLSATDAAEGLNTTYGPSLRVANGANGFLHAAPHHVNHMKGATTAAETGTAAPPDNAQTHDESNSNNNNNNNNSNNNENNSGNFSRGISSVSGLPLSPASSKPHSPTSMLAAPLRVSTSQLIPAQPPQGNSSAGDVGHGQTAVDVSSSSGSDSEEDDEGKNRDGDEATKSKHTSPQLPQDASAQRPASTEERVSLMSEEAVEKLGSNNNYNNNTTMNSFEGETLVTGGSPALARMDISDTMLQPPTSILSEPSTLDTTTANLASLRNRAQARKAAERPGSASGRRLTPQQRQQHAQLLSGSGSNDGAVLPPLHESPVNDNEEDAFSRVSATECADGAASPLHPAPSLVDTRQPVGPSQLLSFSGTAHTFLRLGDDEDVDVDPSSTFTDFAARSLATTQPITFYEAYMEAIKDMKRAAAKQHPAANADAKATPAAPKAAATPATHEAIPGARYEEHKRKRSVWGAIFSCCSPSESDVRTRQPPKPPATYAHPSADLDQVGRGRSIWSSEAPTLHATTLEAEARTAAGTTAVSAAMTAAAATVSPSSAEEALQVVYFLKSRPLSLQNTTHRRMLYTVYNVLTGQVEWPHLRQKAANGGNGSSPATRTPPSSTRAVRWELIGFQGSNPATDVRATGLLGVLQLLYLLDYYPRFTKRLWELCQNPSAVSPIRGVEPSVSSPPRAINGVSNELPFVLVCFNFTAVVLDAAGQHLLDGEIARAIRTHMAPVVPIAGRNKPEAHLAGYPGMFVCCEGFIGALELFAEAWCERRPGSDGLVLPSSSLPPLSRPSIAAFGDLKSKVRAEVLRKNGVSLLRGAVDKVRGETLLGYE